MVATAEQYAAWVKYHGDRFGFSDADTGLLTRWYEVLGCYDYPLLHEATDLMLRTEYPDSARNHLKALLPLVRDLEGRSIRGRAKTARDDDRGSCTQCGGSGWRTDLPNPRSVIEGQWVPPHYTCAVYCLCALGRWIQQNAKRREGQSEPLDFGQYEHRNPTWMIQRGLFYSRLQAEGAALQEAEHEDGRTRDCREHLSALLQRLAEKFSTAFPE